MLLSLSLFQVKLHAYGYKEPFIQPHLNGLQAFMRYVRLEIDANHRVTIWIWHEAVVMNEKMSIILVMVQGTWVTALTVLRRHHCGLLRLRLHQSFPTVHDDLLKLLKVMMNLFQLSIKNKIHKLFTKKIDKLIAIPLACDFQLWYHHTLQSRIYQKVTKLSEKIWDLPWDML